MIKNTFHSCIFFLALSLVTLSAAQAQQKTPPPPTPAPSAPASNPFMVTSNNATPTSTAKFRLLANYNYSLITPNDLNDYRAGLLWNNTTRTQGTFNNLQGFSIGAGYKVEDGFLGIEYSHEFQELTNTAIQPSTLYVQDTFEYDAIYAVYDYVIDRGNYSYELGGGIGYAIKYQYHNLLSNNGATEDVYWEANPIVAKVRAHFNYHFSDNVRARVGAAYEYATSSSMQADSNHTSVTINGSSVRSGQSLKKIGTNDDVTVDMSGLRLTAGIVVAF